MSDLSLALPALDPVLEPSRPQLPVSAYFDDDLHRREMELIFQHGPRYLGHELAVPEIGDHHALPQEGEGRALVRTAPATPGRTSCAHCTAGPTTSRAS